MESQTPVQPTNPTPAAKKSNSTIIIIVVVVVVLVVLGIAGKLASDFFAKKAAEKITESALGQITGGKVNVDTNSGSVTVQNDQGTATFGTKLPSNYPTDIPLYTGATVVSAITGNGTTGSQGSTVSLTTPDSADKVQAYYDAQLASKGWTKGESATFGPATTFTATKGDRQLSIEILNSSTDNLTSILVAETVNQ